MEYLHEGYFGVYGIALSGVNFVRFCDIKGKTTSIAVLSFYRAVCGIVPKLISKFHVMRFS